MKTFKELLAEHNTNCQQLHKTSGVPYMTLNDLKNGKSEFKKVNVETALRISEALGYDIEYIYEYLYKKD